MEYTSNFNIRDEDYPLENLTIVQTNHTNMSRVSDLTPQFDFETDDHMFAMITKTYVIPALVVIGTIGNILIFFTVSQRNMGKWSICFYLSAYAVENIIILVPMVGYEWLCQVTGWPYITKLSDWTCKLWQFIMGVTIYSGIWFVFAMLVDQYIAIWLPYKAQSMCTIFMAKFAVVIIIIGLTVVSIHAIWTYELFQNGCYIVHTPNDILTLIWPWVSLSFYCILPLVLIFIFIVLVIYGILTKTSWKKSSSNYQVPSDITFMTVALAIFYVLFVTPATTINVIRIHMPRAWLHNQEFYFNLINIVVIIGDLLTYFNPTFAFFICVSFSPTFRTELMELKGRVKKFFCQNITRRVYEMQVNSGSTGNDPENCSETTPL